MKWNYNDLAILMMLAVYFITRIAIPKHRTKAKGIAIFLFMIMIGVNAVGLFFFSTGVLSVVLYLIVTILSIIGMIISIKSKLVN